MVRDATRVNTFLSARSVKVSMSSSIECKLEGQNKVGLQTGEIVPYISYPAIYI